MRSLGLAIVLALTLAAPAAAREAVVTSFDGVQLHVSFHPAAGLKAGHRAPTILQTHGWGQKRDQNPNSPSSNGTGNVGTGPLRKAGFNVLTWDSRGFGESGGTVEVDSKDFEGRDVQVLLDWLAKQPEARLDRRGDPRVGMHGVSYAGGIELVAAAIDKRIDAIVPTIAWNSLLTSLYKEETVKSGWSSLLYAAGQTGRLDSHIGSAFASGTTTGKLSAEDRAWFESRGPGDALVKRIRVPTMLLQGTADTLFTTSEAIRNYGILRRNHVPVKMMWFCGGHGTCLTGTGPDGHFEAAVIAWLRRYVTGKKNVKTGPGFEWLADDAKWRHSRRWPAPAGKPIIATGTGTLVLSPADTVSGNPTAAAPAANAVNVAIPAATAQVVGLPRLRLTYSGTGTVTHVFAQIVDEQRNVVVGNLVTPIPVTLDGASHTVARPLEGIAASLTPTGRYHLQIIGGSQVYGPVRGAAAITFSAVGLKLPTVGRARACRTHRRFAVRLPHRLRSAKVWVAGKRVKVRRHRFVVDARGTSKRKVTARIVAHRRNGDVVRQRRVYRFC
ncbi:MAG TPA: CocE/NonD family hydrolase [Solirubrobacteraceae bacterium]|nr:CocE/NonD family hydrolase [Solirubrobacteraceae bacterium]